MRRPLALLACLLAAIGACMPFTSDPPGALLEDPGDGAAGSSPPCDPAAPFGAPVVVPGLANTGAGSIEGLRLSRDYLVAYFAATGLPDDVGYHDIYATVRPDTGAPFGAIFPLDATGINTPADDLDPTVSGDGLTFCWASGEPGGSDPMHIYHAARALASVPFTDEGLDPTVNDATAWLDINPFLREDGAVLYFASNRVPADSTDLYRALRVASADAAFDPPTPVTELNTTYSELGPVVTPDDRTIYYGSNRTDGNAQGDYDIWMATRSAPDGVFSEPVNVGELNSPALDIPTFATRDNCTLYFSSARSGVLLAYVATRRPTSQDP